MDSWLRGGGDELYFFPFLVRVFAGGGVLLQDGLEDGGEASGACQDWHVHVIQWIILLSSHLGPVVLVCRFQNQYVGYFRGVLRFAWKDRKGSLRWSILYIFLIKNINKMSQASPNMLSDVASPSAVFSVEGNIGCGKSSFLSALRNRLPEVQWIQQPVEEWKAVGNGNTNLLERYYTDPHRWGFTFQVFAAFTRLRNIQQAALRFPDKVKISERSILADKHVFSELMCELGFMAQSEYQIFKSLYISMEAMAPVSNPRLIYLRCDPQICFERIAHRKRPQEADISLEYLQKLHDKHEKWMQSHDPSQVLILDAGQDFCNSEELLGRMVEQLVSFVRAGASA